jgi:hypothetical protein
MSLADELLADLDDLGTGAGEDGDEGDAAAAYGAGAKRARGADGGSDSDSSGSDDDDDDDDDAGEDGEDGDGADGDAMDADGGSGAGDGGTVGPRKSKTIGGLDLEAIAKASDIHAIAKLVQSRHLVDALKVRVCARACVCVHVQAALCVTVVACGGPAAGAARGRLYDERAADDVCGHGGGAPRIQAGGAVQPPLRGY